MTVSPAELSAVPTEKAPLWEALSGYMEAAYGVEPTFIPPSGKYGWEVKYRKAGRTLVALSPTDHGFTALVVLGAAETPRARALELGEHVREVLETAKQYHDGRWLFVPVESERDVRDVEALVALKRRPLPQPAA